MLKIILLISIQIIFCFDIFAQKEDYIWMTGIGNKCYNGTNNGGGLIPLDFNHPYPDTNSFCQYHGTFEYTNASICDTAGKILMYSNGYRIYDSTGVMMLHGDSINYGDMYITNAGGRDGGESYEQGMLMLRQPGNDSLVYIIHERDNDIYLPNPNRPDEISSLNDLWYSIVNLKMNYNKGAVVLKNHILMNDTLAIGGLSACRHANGRDWWIIIPDKSTNRYYLFLLDNLGLHTLPFQQIGDYPAYHPSFPDIRDRGNGQGVFSPNGEKYIYNDNGNGIYIFDFDRCLGILSNPVHIFVGAWRLNNLYAGGTAVSANSRYLYVNLHNRDTAFTYYHVLHQFDLQAQNIRSSDVIIDSSYSNFSGHGAIMSWLQIAPDGKIYGISLRRGPIDVIHHPNIRGVGSKYQWGYLNYNYYQAGAGSSIPNFPNFRLGPVDGSACDTLGLDAAIAESSSYLLDFDTTHLGTTKTKSVTIHNHGAKDLVIRNPFIFPSNTPYTFSPATPVMTIHPGDSLVYQVHFHPTSAVDTFTAELRIPHNGNWGLVNVALRGIGVWPVGVTSPNGDPVSYHVYPNPAQESFTLGTTGAFGLNSRVVLSNMLGQVVLQQDLPAGWNKFNVSLGQVPVGVYACTVVSGEKIEQVIKLVRE